jgi:N,N'-diacetyllegionaminate synthase
VNTFVIAECGSCHDGELTKALQLVEAARESGCSAAKFQYWSNPDRLADRRRVPVMYREIYRRYQVPVSWLPVLKEACEARSPWTRGLRPIEFMATCYLPDDVATVAPFVRRFKISSFEANDADFLRAHVPFLPGDERPVNAELIVSLGMGADYSATLRALDGCYWWSCTKALHCVSSYPAPADAMNLSLLRPSPDDDERILYDGLSDHSRHLWMGAMATAAGAQIIEAHIRLEKTSPDNPDYATAFTPAEFAEYIRNIRFAEQVMGTGEKRLQPCELEMAAYKVKA